MKNKIVKAIAAGLIAVCMTTTTMGFCDTTITDTDPHNVDVPMSLNVATEYTIKLPAIFNFALNRDGTMYEANLDVKLKTSIGSGYVVCMSAPSATKMKSTVVKDENNNAYEADTKLNYDFQDPNNLSTYHFDPDELLVVAAVPYNTDEFTPNVNTPHLGSYDLNDTKTFVRNVGIPEDDEFHEFYLGKVEVDNLDVEVVDDYAGTVTILYGLIPRVN